MKQMIYYNLPSAILIFFIFLFAVSGASNTDRLSIAGTVMLVYFIILLLHEAIIQMYFTRRKYWQYIALAVVLLLIVSSLVHFTILKYTRIHTGYISSVFNVLFLLSMGVAVRFMIKSFYNRYQLQETKAKQLEAELKLLHTQINPHFLFNTLNNIYGLNLYNPEQGSEMILKLSDLMRYQTESSQKNMVPLKDEIEFLQNYIDLEKIRLSKNSLVQFTLQGHPSIYKVPPFLLITFIENAFKHGIGATEENYIRINIGIGKGELDYSVTNSKPAKGKALPSTFTGLNNIKKRLALLYPDKYVLTISDNEREYEAVLKIKL